MACASADRPVSTSTTDLRNRICASLGCSDRTRSARSSAAALWPLLCAALAMPARAATAEELSEVTRLHRADQSAAALERAERVLSLQPKDAQMRFLKAVVLVDTGRSAEAQAILQQMVQDYPELAEPHNNLAAIYAAAGDYGKSRAELEETIRLN